MNHKHVDSTLCGAICLIVGWGAATLLHECCHLAAARSLGLPASLGKLTLTTDANDRISICIGGHDKYRDRTGGGRRKHGTNHHRRTAGAALKQSGGSYGGTRFLMPCVDRCSSIM